MALLRSASAADDPARDELHRRCFGFAPPAGMWAWKYRECPHGAAIEHVIAVDGELAAAFALQPRRLACGAAELLGFQAADAMTAPPAQRRGHFARLLASTEEEARARGGALLWAFGGARSNASFARAGWRELGRTHGVRTALHGLRAWLLRRGASERFARVARERLGADFAVAAAAHEPCAGRRDAAWLAWRTRAPRYRGYVAASGAMALVELHATRAVLADLAPASAWQREPALWRGLGAALRADGAKQVELTLFEGERLAAAAARAGFAAPRGDAPRPFWWKPLRAEVEAEVLASRERWIRDLDRDAEGLLLRAATAAGSAA